MHRLIYLSQAVSPFSNDHLLQLLAHARHFNKANALTGILLYGNHQFMQVLEGEEATVRALYARIRLDQRHRNVQLYRDQPCPQRTFGQWQMAFYPKSPQHILEFASYVQPESLRLEQPGLSMADTQLLHLLHMLVLS